MQTRNKGEIVMNHSLYVLIIKILMNSLGMGISLASAYILIQYVQEKSRRNKLLECYGTRKKREYDKKTPI